MKSKLILFLFFSMNLFSQNIGNDAFYIHTENLIKILETAGNTLSHQDKNTILKLIESKGGNKQIEAILDKHVLFDAKISSKGELKLKPGIAKPELIQSGWKYFLVKVNNIARITDNITIESQEAQRVYDGGEKIYGMDVDGKGSIITDEDIKKRWLDFGLFSGNLTHSITPEVKTTYFIVQLYSRDAEEHYAQFTFNSENLNQKAELKMKFNCLSSKLVTLEILDDDLTPTTASLTIKDTQGNIYPSPTKRLAPDLFFESQIYRSNGDKIDLPIGKYTIEYTRGAEYLVQTKELEVTNEENQTLKLALKRWINPMKNGYYSGDSHIHASGCSHYTSPTQGITPNDMIPRIVGEGVNVGVVLIWGRGYDFQKQFFEGKDHQLSTKNNLMHYDMEISVFPSGHAGHLVLLNLKDQNYPEALLKEDWPTYTIPILKWAKSQGAINGYAHSGLGLEVSSSDLPNYELPKFDGIGANEYVVSVTQDLVDFISAVDTPPNWELNIWYHTLNCGFRTRIVGETDYPCLTDDKVAHGRSYVKIDKELNYNEWTNGLKLGKSYVSEGKSHLMDFKVNDIEVGTHNSEINLLAPSKVIVSAKVSGLLNETINPALKPINYSENIWEQKPFWNLERGRIGTSRTVPVELIVNGEVRATKIIEANGSIQDIVFETEIEKSSWVALRILPSSHTNPIFVLVDHKPIRASRKSAEWCLKAVDVCWAQKESGFSKSAKDEAKKDYEEAKKIYQKIIEETK